MASESHTTISPSWRHGTRPVGENAWNVGVGLDPSVGSGTRRSRNGISRCCIRTHGRSDHDE
jgi:hypothetical protein